MKHHGYPAKGTGSHSYTWNGKTISADFEHNYDWASMPAEYDGTNDAAFDGVARLMADLGVAVEMKYNKTGSGAYIGDLVTALQKYYGYSKLSHLMAIEDVGAEAWNGRLRDEIDANRPVLYAASDPNTGGGHAFVIDGYKDESFSVNWGWGGLCDGFYKIGALNPESAGKPTGDQYNVGQSAVFGMQPSDGTEKVSTMGFLKVTGELQTLNMNVTDVKKGQRCTFFSATIGNSGDHSFTGEIVVALMNAKGEQRQIVAVADERGELTGVDCKGKMLVSPGCDVYTRCSKAAAVEMSLRCMNPRFILCDELGTAEDAAALEWGVAAGSVCPIYESSRAKVCTCPHRRSCFWAARRRRTAADAAAGAESMAQIGRLCGAVGGGFVGIGGAAWRSTLCSRSRRPASLWRC